MDTTNVKKCIAADHRDPLCMTKAGLYQDKRYGRGMRVHTPRVKPEEAPRCTVCGRENQK